MFVKGTTGKNLYEIWMKNNKNKLNKMPQKKEIENVVCKMTTVLSQTKCVKYIHACQLFHDALSQLGLCFEWLYI